MQPQSEKNIIQRFLEWWRGRPGGDASSRTSSSHGSSETTTGEPDSVSSTSSIGDSFASNAGGASGTLRDRMTEVGDKVSGTAGTTATSIPDQAKDTPDALGASASGNPEGSAGNTDDTVRLDDLTSSQSGSSTRDAENASQQSSVPGGGEGMRSLYQGSKSASSVSENPTRNAGATETDSSSDASNRDVDGRNASLDTAGNDDDRGETAGAAPDLNRGDSSSAPDAGSSGDSDQQTSTAAAAEDQRDDLSGTAYDRTDAGATFRDLSAADSLATGSFADEDVLDRPDPDLQGVDDLRAEDLGMLEDIEIESAQQESGDELGTWSPSDTDAENDRSELAGLAGNEPDASATKADQPEDILVVEEDVIIVGWDTDAGSALETSTDADASSASDSAEPETAQDDTVGISGMPGTSTASGMPDAAESNLAADDEPGNSVDSETNATLSSSDKGTLTADKGSASDAINSSSAPTSRTTGVESSSAADADAAGRLDSGTTGSAGDLEGESTGTGSPEHFGFLGYDNAATTDLGYLNQSNARRFDFGTDVQTASQAGKPAAAPLIPSDQRSTSTDEKSAQISAYVRTDTEPETMRSGTASHTTTDDATSDQATTGSQVQSEQTGPGGSIRGDKSGSCPAEYPIKGNGSSKIYHMPGIPSYRGTKAEFCFATEADAIAAGFRAPGHRNHGGGTAGSAASGKTGSSTADTHTHIDLAAPPASISEDSVSQSQSSDASKSAARAVGSTALPAAASGDTEDQFGSGSDDIESLQRQSPDDIASAGSAQSDAGASVATDEESQSDKHAGQGTVGAERQIAGAVPGDGSRSCPAEYPIKGNAGSMIYHSPGRSSYDATIAEWCFATEEDAVKAGFRAPKR